MSRKLHEARPHAAIWWAFDRITAELPEAERLALFHDNAAQFYPRSGAALGKGPSGMRCAA